MLKREAKHSKDNSEHVEFRFHGRGGQGAKSASEIYAAAALEEIGYIQCFPDYGPERQGAPIRTYLRISSTPITVHSGVTNPDYVVVIDPSLLESINVTEGLKKDGAVIANTKQTKEKLKKILNYDGKIYTVDATQISLDTFGKSIPNTPMLGAVAKVTGLVNLDTLKQQLEHKFLHKLGEEGVKKNIEALERAYKEVR